MTNTMQLGPETPGRPTVAGVVAVKLKGVKVPGFVWCEAPGKSISRLCATPGEARLKKPRNGKLADSEVEHKEIEHWRLYVPPPPVPWAERLRAAMAALRGR